VITEGQGMNFDDQGTGGSEDDATESSNPGNAPMASVTSIAARRAQRSVKRIAAAKHKAAVRLRADRLANLNTGNAQVAQRRALAALSAGERRSAAVEARRARDRAATALALADYAHKNEGTAQTHAHASRVKQSALSRMVRLGKASADELAAAIEIAEVIEMLEAGVTMRTAQLERVDNMGAGRDALVEGLKRVRMEVAYGLWRDSLPVPKRLIIDMVIDARSYVSLAKTHGLHWRTARKRFLRALQDWPRFVAEARRQVSREDLNAAHAALGHGDGQ